MSQRPSSSSPLPHVVRPASRLATATPWHEVGHAANPAGSETWADAFAWCRQPIAGVSYRLKPTDCAPYL